MGLGEAVLRGLMYSLISPTVFIPAWAIGWFTRTWWQAVAGAVALAVVLIVISRIMLEGRMPEGAHTVWWLVPLGVVPPLIHASIAHLLHDRLGRNPASAGAGLGIRIISAAIGLAIGLCVGAAIGALVGEAYVEWAHVSQFEGGAGYMVFFLFLIPGGLIGAALGAILAWRIASRRLAAKP